MKDIITSILFLPPETPWYLLPIIGLFMLFMAYVLLARFKAWILKHSYQKKLWAKIIFVAGGIRFVVADLVGNGVCFSVIVWHRPNQFGEGWMITKHANAILKYYIKQFKANAASHYKTKLTRHDKWKLAVSMFICKHLNREEDGHCSAYDEINQLMIRMKK